MHKAGAVEHETKTNTKQNHCDCELLMHQQHLVQILVRAAESPAVEHISDNQIRQTRSA
jgi:hypothetical protein